MIPFRVRIRMETISIRRRSAESSKVPTHVDRFAGYPRSDLRNISAKYAMYQNPLGREEAYQ